MYDIGVAGDDADEFLEAFVEEFKVAPESLRGFDWVKQFGNEGISCSQGFLATIFLLLLLTLCFVPLPGWIILCRYFQTHSRKLHEEGLADPDAVTVKDLIDAATAQRWMKGQSA